jgi:RNA polymerase sigma-70 factor (ECF subfamily)
VAAGHPAVPPAGARAIATRPAAADAVPSEAQLLARLRAGDESAFDQIVRQYEQRVYQYAYRLVQDPDEASDVAQETFIRAHARLGDFRGDASLNTWLYRIASNLGINALRKRRLRAFVGLDQAPAVQAPGGPEDDLAAAEIRRRVEAAVALLPPRQRSIFILRHYEQLTHREIATVVGSSQGAVRAGYFHAVRKLRAALRDLTEDGAEGKLAP